MPASPAPSQVFLAAGLIVAVFLFFVFPRAIKVLGLTTYQRLGCLAGIPAFLIVPNARSLSWNNTGVFMVSVACTVLIYCCQAMVRDLDNGLISKFVRGVGRRSPDRNKV